MAEVGLATNSYFKTSMAVEELSSATSSSIFNLDRNHNNNLSSRVNREDEPKSSDKDLLRVNQEKLLREHSRALMKTAETSGEKSGEVVSREEVEELPDEEPIVASLNVKKIPLAMRKEKTMIVVKQQQQQQQQQRQQRQKTAPHRQQQHQQQLQQPPTTPNFGTTIVELRPFDNRQHTFVKKHNDEPATFSSLVNAIDNKSYAEAEAKHNKQCYSTLPVNLLKRISGTKQQHQQQQQHQSTFLSEFINHRSSKLNPTALSTYSDQEVAQVENSNEYKRIVSLKDRRQVPPTPPPSNQTRNRFALKQQPKEQQTQSTSSSTPYSQ